MDELRCPSKTVVKDQLKILLGDEHNAMVAYVHRNEIFRFSVDDSAFMFNYRLANGTITIHDKTMMTW